MPICPECHTEGTEVGEPCPDDEYYFVADQTLRKVGNDPLLGVCIADKFVVIDRLAEGGMGAIYRALQLPMRREVAIKVLKAEVDRSNTGRKRFAREARAISRLSHPNIITLHDFGFDGASRPYMVMEYASGQPVSHWLQEADLTTDRLLHVARQILSALAEAHNQDVIHRDLKPANVMVTRAGNDQDFAKLLDFGLARLVNRETRAGLTRDGEVFGTPHFMSPEQARSSGDIGPASDVYAMGILLFRFFCGRVPFDSDRPLQVLFQHIEDPLPPLEAADGLVLPEPVADVIRQSTQKEPEDRYGDASVMLDAFDEAVEKAGNRGSLRRRQHSPTPGSIDAVSPAENRTSSDDAPPGDSSRESGPAMAPTLADATPEFSETMSDSERPGPSPGPEATGGDTVQEFSDHSPGPRSDNEGTDTEKAWRADNSGPHSDKTAPEAEATVADRNLREAEETEPHPQPREDEGSSPKIAVAAAIAGLMVIGAASAILVVSSGEDAPTAEPNQPQPDQAEIAETSRQATLVADRAEETAEAGTAFAAARPPSDAASEQDEPEDSDGGDPEETDETPEAELDDEAPTATEADDSPGSSDPAPQDRNDSPQQPEDQPDSEDRDLDKRDRVDAPVGEESDDEANEDQRPVEPQPFERPGDDS